MVLQMIDVVGLCSQHNTIRRLKFVIAHRFVRCDERRCRLVVTEGIMLFCANLELAKFKAETSIALAYVVI
jgi:hypothetical protein